MDMSSQMYTNPLLHEDASRIQLPKGYDFLFYNLEIDKIQQINFTDLGRLQ